MIGRPPHQQSTKWVIVATLFGSVSKRVVQTAAVSVLIVNPYKMGGWY